MLGAPETVPNRSRPVPRASCKPPPLRQPQNRPTHLHQVPKRAAASVVQVCEANSAGSEAWAPSEWGKRVSIGSRDLIRSPRAASCLCTCVGTPFDPADPCALLSPEQVARICGLSRRAVYRAIARGDLPAARLCNRLRVRPEDLDRWIRGSVEPRSIPQPDVIPSPTPPLRGSLRSMLDDLSTNGSSAQ